MFESFREKEEVGEIFNGAFVPVVDVSEYDPEENKFASLLRAISG